MVVVNKLESLLVVPLLVFSIVAQENSGYGLPNFSSSGRSFTGPSGNTGSDGRTGPSGLPTARGRILGPSAPTARGRIVSNSILDFEPGPIERDNGSRQGYSRQQPGFTSRPITTGPSVVGTNLIDERNSQSNVNPNTQEQKIYRFLSIHVRPPESPPSQRPRPTPAPVKPETHYQIVFIKAPSPISQELQEIQLPPPPEMKTLVYVLLKKPSMSDLVKISQRPKPKVNKPEVFFLRYSQPKGNQQLPFQAQPERRQQDGMQPEGRQQFPQQQPDGRQQFPQQQQERRQQFPQQQEEIQQFSQQQEGRQFPQQQQGGTSRFHYRELQITAAILETMLLDSRNSKM
ncbi:hypothetical protein Ocin01_05560 [Orchesella cincta]|uniref:DUF243 domain-containing protein n=1 Tax=Orchesella cincta TaxID=48709 RepID=A0A1D2N7B2_ORCCI|nr:hypothetical protein Ocin01_05560 [Orchesella cincta]